MSDKAKEAELSNKLEKLPLNDTNEPPLSKAVGSAEKVIQFFIFSYMYGPDSHYRIDTSEYDCLHSFLLSIVTVIVGLVVLRASHTPIIMRSC